MIAELPERWQQGLSAVLAAETEQMALEAAVGTIARIVNAPTVGILKGRSEHLSSVAALQQDQYVAPLFVEALRMVDPRLLADTQRHLALLDDRSVFRLVFHDEEQVLGAICTLETERAGNLLSDAPYFAILK